MSPAEPSAETSEIEKPTPVVVAGRSTYPTHADAQDTRDAVIGWMKNELSKGTERAYDLGKFLFTVSIGTAGLVATIMKDARWPALFIAAIFFNALSGIAALAMAWPKTWTLDENADLWAEYNRAMKKNLLDLKRWGWFYGVAFVLSAIAIMTRK